MKILLSLISLLLSCCQLYALGYGDHPCDQTLRHYTFSHIGLRDGLPDCYIGSIFRLPDGRMGMRATDLIIWDGARFIRHPEPATPFYRLAFGSVNFNQHIDSSGRLWMRKRDELRVFDVNRDRYITNVDSLFALIGLNRHVNALYADSRGSLWIVTDEGISCYGSENGLRTVMRKNSNNYPEMLMAAERGGDDSYVWLVFSSGEVIKWDTRNNQTAERYDYLKGLVRLGDQVIVKPIGEALIAIMTDNSVGIFNDDTREYTPLLPVNTNPGHKYTSMEIDSEGNLWISRTRHGLYITDPQKGGIIHLDGYELTSGVNIVNDIQHIGYDPVSGGMWLALHDNGMLYYDRTTSGKQYTGLSTQAGLKEGENIITLIRRRNGKLLAGTGKGIVSISDEDFSPQPAYSDMNGKLCRVLYEDRERRLWIGTFANGLYCLDGDTLRHILYSTTDYHDNVNYNNIRTVRQDPQGRIWVAVYGSVGYIDPSSGEYNPIIDSDSVYRDFGLISEITFDSDGHMLGACEKGTFIHDPATGKTRRLLEGYGKSTAMYHPAYMRTNSLVFDRDSNLWIGSHTGIYVLTDEGNLISHGLYNGFSSPIHNVTTDKRDRIWLSTVNNIYRATISYDTIGQQIPEITLRSYLDDGTILRGDQLSFNIIAEGRRIIASARKGIVSVEIPSTDDTDTIYAPHAPIFNYLHVSEKEVSVGEMFNGRVPVDHVLGSNPTVELEHNESSLSIGFVNLFFRNMEQSTYRYVMEGIDSEWSQMTFNGPQGQVNYNSLPPGTYRLRVHSIGNSDTLSSEAVFTIVIRPPWWLSPWIKILWTIMVIVLIVATCLLIRRQSLNRFNKALERQEQSRRKELEDMKLRFFTNISHELRTPLTLIITPLQSIIEKTPESSPLHTKLSNIHQNARNLLMQVNQLLDFRKLEVGADRFDPRPCNIADLVRVVSSSFMTAAGCRHLDFSLDLPQQRIVVNADRPKLSKIISNLLSNALKYTPDGGMIMVAVAVDNDNSKAIITVSDNGIGIPPGETGRIFERFYRASNSDDIVHTQSSSGIGLHLVKEYVTMHGGEATVQSQPGSGSVFTVTLPLLESGNKPIVITGHDDDSQPVILLAEDNDEFRSFMTGELSEHYRVASVADGRQALEQARLVNPSIIVSDVMMPVMDGIELTKAIKTDIETSHIPVVLLTAHANESSEAIGYEAGADAYISKPFNMHVLLTRIANLIEQQHGRWEKFEKHLEVNPSEISITSPDEKLIGKALQCVERHIDDSNFTVDDLSDALAMSKATMYRKLQAITGQTPNNFIRTIRLKRAAQLLQSSRLSVSEIAYCTGFASPKYFSRLFKEEFGILPTDYRQEEKRKEK